MCECYREICCIRGGFRVSLNDGVGDVPGPDMLVNNFCF